MFLPLGYALTSVGKASAGKDLYQGQKSKKQSQYFMELIEFQIEVFIFYYVVINSIQPFVPQPFTGTNCGSLQPILD